MQEKAFSEPFSPSFSHIFHSFLPTPPALPLLPTAQPSRGDAMVVMWPIIFLTQRGEIVTGWGEGSWAPSSELCSQDVSFLLDFKWVCTVLLTGKPGVPEDQAKSKHWPVWGAPWRKLVICVKEFVQMPRSGAIQERPVASKEQQNGFVAHRDRRIMNLSFQQMAWKIESWRRLGYLILLYI